VLFSLLYLVGIAGFHIIARQPNGVRGGQTLGLLCYLTLVGGVAAWWQRRTKARYAQTQWIFVAIVGVGLLVLIPVVPYTTHDLSRYLWDGAAVLAGLDPYSVSPNSPTARIISQQWPVAPEHSAYTTLYPPGALALFAFCAATGQQYALVVWKTLAAFGGIALVIATAALSESKKSVWPWVCFMPLVPLEVGIGAHLDVFSALALAIGLWAHKNRRWWLTGVALGVGGLVKFLPLAALLPLCVAASKRGAASKTLMAATAVFFFGFALALSLGLRPPGSLGLFLSFWQFGSPLQTFAGLVFGSFSSLVVLFVGVCLGSFFAWTLWRLRWPSGESWFGLSLCLSLGIPLLLSRVVFPWYLLVLLPVVQVTGYFTLVGWLLVLPFTYEVLDQFDLASSWQPATWPLGLVVGAWLTGLTIDLVLHARRNPKSS